jgi:hypothetical protein
MAQLPPNPIVIEGSQDISEMVVGMADCLYSICNVLEITGACSRKALAEGFKATLAQQQSAPDTRSPARHYVAQVLLQLLSDEPRKAGQDRN